MPDIITCADAFLTDVFVPDDRITLTLVLKSSPPPPIPGALPLRQVEQRTFAAREFCRKHRWLRYMNAQHYEIYWLANTVKPGAAGRQKEDIAEIRRLYLDFDVDGDAAVDRLPLRQDLPHPNYVVNTSPGKYQVLWNVQGFALPEAEHVLRTLARDTGADIAATDSSRVLRLPGFFNHKYVEPHRVTALRYHRHIFAPADFPAIAPADHSPAGNSGGGLNPGVRNTHAPQSRSEEDMRNVIVQMRRYEGPPGSVPTHRVQEIRESLEHHRSDKPNPKYYADLTVGKALALIRRDPRVPRTRTW